MKMANVYVILFFLCRKLQPFAFGPKTLFGILGFLFNKGGIVSYFGGTLLSLYYYAMNIMGVRINKLSPKSSVSLSAIE